VVIIVEDYVSMLRIAGLTSTRPHLRIRIPKSFPYPDVYFTATRRVSSIITVCVGGTEISTAGKARLAEILDYHDDPVIIIPWLDDDTAGKIGIGKLFKSLNFSHDATMGLLYDEPKRLSDETLWKNLWLTVDQQL